MSSGPFWGYPKPNDGRYQNIPFKKPTGYGVSLPCERRAAELSITRAKSVWQLNGAGCVGGQALLGIPFVNSLRSYISTSIWPFEIKNTKLVCAEIYPSMFKLEDTEIFKDANQVQAVVKQFSELDLKGELKEIMMPMDLGSEIFSYEGWILGVNQ